MSSRFEQTSTETAYEGRIATVHRRTFRHEDGEEALATAQRELAEEIGKAAERWEHLLTFYTSAGFTDEVVHVYLATGLSDRTAEVEENERIDIVTHPLSELDALLDE